MQVLDFSQTPSLKTMREWLNRREISSYELARQYLNRIESHLDYHAFIDVNIDATLKQARMADQRLARGESMPLLGIPIAHKDVFATLDWKTTAASKMLETYQSPFDATVVSRLKAAGTVCLGKTNMDEFAMGSASENSYFGAVDHPMFREYVPGGSSGGSACAVALKLAPIATGSDTGGSIRQPAAFCGITGIKPTYGSTSRFGMIAYASSLDQAGVMGQSAEDCAVILEAIVGADDYDSTCIGHPSPLFMTELEKFKTKIKGQDQPLAGMKIGIAHELMAASDLPTQALILQEIKKFVAAGAEIIEVSLPHTAYTVAAYYIIAPAQASSNLARFDGVCYGYRADSFKNLEDMYYKTREQGFGLEVKKRLMVGAYVLSSNYYDAYYVKAQKVRRLVANDFTEAFKNCDVILGPTSPSPAWKKGTKNTPDAVYNADILTLGVSLAGLPALSLPIGCFNNIDRQNDLTQPSNLSQALKVLDDVEKQLPVGLQIIAPHFEEQKALNLAHFYQMI
jgi:aspartyl-tRNA(Asn)/glutamyl-tRNA(Gln) amidotransferase subunit A